MVHCVQCGADLVAPVPSEYWSDNHACHIWHCPKCCACFSSLVCFSDDTDTEPPRRYNFRLSAIAPGAWRYSRQIFREQLGRRAPTWLCADVRYGSETDISECPVHVRYSPEIRHSLELCTSASYQQRTYALQQIAAYSIASSAPASSVDQPGFTSIFFSAFCASAAFGSVTVSTPFLKLDVRSNEPKLRSRT